MCEFMCVYEKIIVFCLFLSTNEEWIHMIIMINVDLRDEWNSLRLIDVIRDSQKFKRNHKIKIALKHIIIFKWL